MIEIYSTIHWCDGWVMFYIFTYNILKLLYSSLNIKNYTHLLIHQKFLQTLAPAYIIVEQAKLHMIVWRQELYETYQILTELNFGRSKAVTSNTWTKKTHWKSITWYSNPFLGKHSPYNPLRPYSIYCKPTLQLLEHTKRTMILEMKPVFIET